jgi:hypothetical protein
LRRPATKDGAPSLIGVSTVERKRMYRVYRVGISGRYTEQSRRSRGRRDVDRKGAALDEKRSRKYYRRLLVDEAGKPATPFGLPARLPESAACAAISDERKRP